ncbi:MAG: hypothetical protein IIC71_06765 [Acidobacteria bacterium]|nr:hypothetical protein [Acidobacteriota bacterium]
MLFGMALVLAACSGSNVVPATAPPTFAPTTIVVTITTTTEAPTITTTTQVTTTTVDRVAEIEAILVDLVTRRTLAQVERDEAAYREVFANAGFLNESMIVFEADLFEVLPPLIEVDVLAVLSDSPTCIAVSRQTRMEGRGDGEWFEDTTVLELTALGSWGFSFIGEGWVCDGPHPFSDS